MNWNQKIVICHNCRYFPTKLDSPSLNPFSTTSSTIFYECSLCHYRNEYEKKNHEVILPSNCYLKTTASSLFSSFYSPTVKKRYFIVL